MSVGKNIKHFRKKAGLTQVTLAEKANISRSYLADVENDRYNVSLEVLRKISAALNVSSSALLGQDPELFEVETNIQNVKTKILKLVKLLTDDEGFFYPDLRKTIINTFIHKLNVDFSLKTPLSDYSKESLINYFNAPEDYTDSDKEEFISTFNHIFNYRTIKRALDYSYNDIYEIIEGFEKISSEYDYEDKINEIILDDTPLYSQILDNAFSYLEDIKNKPSNKNLINYIIIQAFIAFEMRLNELLLRAINQNGLQTEISIDYLSQQSIFEKLHITLKKYLDFDITGQPYYSELLKCIKTRNLIAHGGFISTEDIDVEATLHCFKEVIDSLSHLDKKLK